MSDTRHATKTCLRILVRLYFPPPYIWSHSIESWGTKANRFAGWEISENPSSVCLVSIFSLVVLVYHWIHKSIEYRTFPALMYCCIEKEETFFRFYFSIGVSYTVSLTRGDFKCRLMLGSYRKLIHWYFFYFRVSNSRTCICTNFQSKRVIPITCWAFKLIQNQEAFFNNINLSIFTNHMYDVVLLFDTLDQYEFMSGRAKEVNQYQIEVSCQANKHFMASDMQIHLNT